MKKNKTLIKELRGKKPQKRTYFIEEKDGRFYVYYLTFAPVQTLFDVSRSREDAERAINDHKAGKHSTQESGE